MLAGAEIQAKKDSVHALETERRREKEKEAVSGVLPKTQEEYGRNQRGHRNRAEE